MRLSATTINRTAPRLSQARHYTPTPTLKKVSSIFLAGWGGLPKSAAGTRTLWETYPYFRAIPYEFETFRIADKNGDGKFSPGDEIYSKDGKRKLSADFPEIKNFIKQWGINPLSVTDLRQLEFYCHSWNQAEKLAAHFKHPSLDYYLEFNAQVEGIRFAAGKLGIPLDQEKLKVIHRKAAENALEGSLLEAEAEAHAGHSDAVFLHVEDAYLFATSADLPFDLDRAKKCLSPVLYRDAFQHSTHGRIADTKAALGAAELIAEKFGLGFDPQLKKFLIQSAYRNSIRLNLSKVEAETHLAAPDMDQIRLWLQDAKLDAQYSGFTEHEQEDFERQCRSLQAEGHRANAATQFDHGNVHLWDAAQSASDVDIPGMAAGLGQAIQGYAGGIEHRVRGLVSYLM